MKSAKLNPSSLSASATTAHTPPAADARMPLTPGDRIGMLSRPAQNRHSPQIPLKMLQHMNEFMADQQATHQGVHWPLLQRDRAKTSGLGAIGGIFAGQLRFASLN